jgi:hypothetical protein
METDRAPLQEIKMRIFAIGVSTNIRAALVSKICPLPPRQLPDRKKISPAKKKMIVFGENPRLICRRRK